MLLLQALAVLLPVTLAATLNNNGFVEKRANPCRSVKASLSSDDQYTLAQEYCSTLLSVPPTTHTVTKTTAITVSETSTKTTTIVVKAKAILSTVTEASASTITSTITVKAGTDLGPSTYTIYSESTLCQAPATLQARSLLERQDAPIAPVSSTTVSSAPVSSTTTSADSDPTLPALFSTMDLLARSSACSCVKIPPSEVLETTFVTATKTAKKPIMTTQVVLERTTPIRITTTTTPVDALVTVFTTKTITTISRNTQTSTVTVDAGPVFPDFVHIAVQGRYVSIDSTGKIVYVNSNSSAATFKYDTVRQGDVVATSGTPWTIWTGLDDRGAQEALLPVIFVNGNNIRRPASTNGGFYPVDCYMQLDSASNCELHCEYWKGSTSYVDNAGLWYLGGSNRPYVSVGQPYTEIIPQVYAAQ